MSTSCYAMVRGSAIRITELDARGEPTPRFAVSRAVARVTLTEVVEAGSGEIATTPDGERRINLRKSSQLIRYRADIDFLRVDPGVFALLAGTTPAVNAAGDLVGFDSGTRNGQTGFALEVWSQLDGAACANVESGEGGFGFGEEGFGEGGFGGAGGLAPRMWGYTLFPHLRGGSLGRFTFANAAVNFSLTRAQTRTISRWGVGPYDLSGAYERLLTPVSGNHAFRQFITPAAPPEQANGIQITPEDILSNGNAANPMPYPDAPLVVSGGTASTTSPWIIQGGRA